MHGAGLFLDNKETDHDVELTDKYQYDMSLGRQALISWSDTPATMSKVSYKVYGNKINGY